MRDAQPDDPGARRYARHHSLAGFGVTGQRRLAAARVLVVGAGGLGSPVISSLAGCGVGHLVVMDPDVVEISNLPRQLIHTEAAIGTAKVTSVQRAVAAQNSGVEVSALPERLSVTRALELVAEVDVVVDCTDSIEARYVLNDACVLLGVPLVWASIAQYAGQFGVVEPAVGPCYRCVFPDPQAVAGLATCEEAGVLGVLPGVLGAMQAVEVIKLCSGIGAPARDAIRLYDALGATMATLPVARDPECRVCGLEAGYFEGVAGLEGVDAPPGFADFGGSGGFGGLGAAGGPGADGRAAASGAVAEIGPQEWPDAGFVLIDVRNPDEVEAAPLPPCMTVGADETFVEPWAGGWNEATRASVHARVGERDVVLVCARGARSRAAAGVLGASASAMEHAAASGREAASGQDATPGDDAAADGSSRSSGRILSVRGGLAAAS